MNIKRRFATLTIITTAVLATTVTGGVAAANAAASAESAAKKDDAATSSTAQVTPEVAELAKARGVGVQEALEAYWTPERMRAARPDSELPAVKEAQANAQGGTGTPTVELRGTPGRVAGAESTVPNGADQSGVSAKTDQSGVTPQSYYPNLPVGHPTAMTVGKVFFTLAGGNYVCSGATVNTEGKATVWTAGHCLSGSAQWASNWCFVPNYVDGYRPFGTWCAFQLWTLNGWFYNGDFDYDVGAALVYRQFGYCITNYLGGQGIAWNYPIGQYVYAFGYPAAYPFDGQRLVAEQGSTYDGTYFPYPDPGTIFMVNDMTGGSSGGPWLAWYDGNYGYINGHNDFKYTAYLAYMFSAYYGNQVANLYNSVRYTTC